MGALEFRSIGMFSVLAAAASLAAAQQAPPAPAAPAARFVVVLDAAHGGGDTGGRLSDGQAEKAFTLAFSTRLRSLLAARGIQVVTSRESDVSVDQDRRAEIANHARAQACLSLHASDTGSANSFGAHLFVSSLAPAGPVRFAAWKTAQAAWVSRSLSLAGTLNSSLLHAGMTVTLARIALPAIDSMTCPAVAIEIMPESAKSAGSGQQSLGALDDPDYQARVAEALAAALLEWRADSSRTETGHPEARP